MSRSDRRFGPAVGEPPVLVDPRRWGALIGIVGGLVFIFSYAPSFGAAISIGARAVGVGLALIAVLGHYIRPRSLGPFHAPTRPALVVYVGCVAGELVALAVGSRLLVGVGHADLRPALIAGVVGVHFLPFAWAFAERWLCGVGLALLVLGSAGLIAGYVETAYAANAAAVLSGLVMLVFTALQARGRFAPVVDASP